MPLYVSAKKNWDESEDVSSHRRKGPRTQQVPPIFWELHKHHLVLGFSASALLTFEQDDCSQGLPCAFPASGKLCRAWGGALENDTIPLMFQCVQSYQGKCTVVSLSGWQL